MTKKNKFRIESITRELTIATAKAKKTKITTTATAIVIITRTIISSKTKKITTRTTGVK